LKVSNLIDESSIILDIPCNDKWSVVELLAKTLKDRGVIVSVEDFMRDVRERERQVTTGVGMGIAIPHARSVAVKQVGVALGRCLSGIPGWSIDGEPVRIIFLFAVPNEAADESYLEALAGLSRLLIDDELRGNLMGAKTKADVKLAIERAEAVL